MKYLLMLSFLALSFLGSPSSWSAPKPESKPVVLAKKLPHHVRKAHRATRKPAAQNPVKEVAATQDTPEQSTEASPPIPISLLPIPIATETGSVAPLPQVTATVSGTLLKVANPYLRQPVAPIQAPPNFSALIPWAATPILIPNGIGPGGIPTLNEIGVLVTSFMPTLPTLPPQLAGFLPTSFLPGDPGASHFPISIKTVYPTGDKPLVVLTLKCPTEAAFGVAPPPVKLVHIILTAGMDGINATGLLPVNLQQVCQ